MKVLSKILTRIILNSFFGGLFFGMTLYQAFVGSLHYTLIGAALSIFYLHLAITFRRLILTAKEKSDEQDSSQTKS
jgi:hypothetical protein